MPIVGKLVSAVFIAEGSVVITSGSQFIKV